VERVLPPDLEELLTPGYRRHASPAAGPAASPEELRAVIEKERLDVPDLTVTVADRLIGQDRAVFRWTSEGTDSGPGDYPPTHRRFQMAGITWLRLEGGRIAEEWSSADTLDALLQLGFTVHPPE
jgi:predicted ester cyclase